MAPITFISRTLKQNKTTLKEAFRSYIYGIANMEHIQYWKKLEQQQSWCHPSKIPNTDISFVENRKPFNFIDKFSKLFLIFHVRSSTEIPQLMEQISVIHPNCCDVITWVSVYCTNDKQHPQALRVRHFTTFTRHSMMNGQRGRVHSRLFEIARTIAE